MKRNLKRITFIITLTFAWNMQTITISSQFTKKQEQIRKLEDEETRKTDAEIEKYIVDSAIAHPQFKEPSFWEIKLREYGIPIFIYIVEFKRLIVNAMTNLKDAICERPAE